MKHRKLTTTPEISKRMANVHLKKEAFDIVKIIKSSRVLQI